jgi:cystathionine beta-lyase/cystathionine gamma-synthase
VMANVKSGDHVICVSKPYSWTHYLFSSILPKYGIRTTFIDGRNVKNFDDALTGNTVLFYLESPNSWTFELQDMESVTRIARSRNIISIADNSYNTPFHQNPSQFGVDIVVHSASKYLAGHSDVVAGVLCSNQQMIWKIFRNEFMTFGGIVSPFDAWLILRGLRTLELRLEKSTQNAVSIIEAIRNHSAVEKIIYPFLNDFPQLELAKKQMKQGSGLFSILLRTKSQEKIRDFCESLQYFRLAVSWGGHESLVFPAIAVLNQNQNANHAFPLNLIRFYAGLENTEMLIEDIRQALSKIN